MARNSEKAMTALARWRRAKEEEEGTNKKHVKRPYLASECDNLQDAERWRQQTIRDISKSVTAIQNAGLGEFRIRDLNDHINKLLREKKHWENRIRELGGKSYSSKGAKMLDREGREVPGNRGYKYFGASKDLPGVRELFESDTPVNTKKTRAELMKDVDAQYYGFRDDEDGLLVPLELQAEKETIGRLVNEWKGAKEGEMTDKDEDDEDLYIKDMKDDEEALREAMEAGKEGRFSAHVKVPTQADIEEALLRRKKQELLELFAIDSTVEQVEEEVKQDEEAKQLELESQQNQNMDTSEDLAGKFSEDMSEGPGMERSENPDENSKEEPSEGCREDLATAGCSEGPAEKSSEVATGEISEGPSQVTGDPSEESCENIVSQETSDIPSKEQAEENPSTKSDVEMAEQPPGNDD